MATKKIKKDNLPKGIMWREDKQCYLGRFTYQKKQYLLYDEEWKRLSLRMENLREEVRKGIYTEECGLTLNEWFDKWMETYKKNRLKYNTYHNYLSIYQRCARKTIGRKKLKDVTAEDIQGLLNSQFAKGDSTGTITVLKIVLSGCFKKAVTNRMIPVNPILLTEVPKDGEGKEKYVFTKEEQRQFMEYASGSRYYGLLRVTLMTGMRNGEVRALRWRDIDMDNRKIHVNHTLIRVYGGGLRLGSPKTRTSKREIPMLSKVYETLSEMKEEADRMGTGGGDNFVFSVPDGSPIDGSYIGAEIRRIRNQMAADGIPVGQVTCHTLRHAFATRAIEGGMKPQVLKTILGHSNISMTMDLYAHVLGDEKTQEMGLLEDVF